MRVYYVTAASIASPYDNLTGERARQDAAKFFSEAGAMAHAATLRTGWANARVDARDEPMDDLHKHLFSVMTDREWPHGVAAAVDVTLLGRFYERYADHAVEVARRVVFLVTGKLPEAGTPELNGVAASAV